MDISIFAPADELFGDPQPPAQRQLCSFTAGLVALGIPQTRIKCAAPSTSSFVFVPSTGGGDQVAVVGNQEPKNDVSPIALKYDPNGGWKEMKLPVLPYLPTAASCAEAPVILTSRHKTPDTPRYTFTRWFWQRWLNWHGVCSMCDQPVKGEANVVVQRCGHVLHIQCFDEQRHRKTLCYTCIPVSAPHRRTVRGTAKRSAANGKKKQGCSWCFPCCC